MGLIIITIIGYILAVILTLWFYKTWNINSWELLEIRKKINITIILIVVSSIFILFLQREISVYNIKREFTNFTSSNNFIKIEITVLKNPISLLKRDRITINDITKITEYHSVMSQKKIFFQNHPNQHWQVKVLFYDSLSNVDKFRIIKFDDDGLDCFYYGNNRGQKFKKNIYFMVDNKLGKMITDDINSKNYGK